MKKKVKEMKKLLCTALRDGGAHVTSILLTTVFSCLISCVLILRMLVVTTIVTVYSHCLKELTEETRVEAAIFCSEEFFC